MTNVKNRLEHVLEEVVALLVECNHSDKAEWFCDRLHHLRDKNCTTSQLEEIAGQIRTILAGMGSFSDLSLVPSEDSDLSVRDAHELQWDLAEALDSVTEEILRSS